MREEKNMKNEFLINAIKKWHQQRCFLCIHTLKRQNTCIHSLGDLFINYGEEEKSYHQYALRFYIWSIECASERTKKHEYKRENVHKQHDSHIGRSHFDFFFILLLLLCIRPST